MSMITSKEAKNILRRLEMELNNLKNKESENHKFCAAVGEDIEDLRPDYDFKTINNEMKNLNKSIMELKHKINAFNIMTYVGDTGLTIDQVLVRMPQINNRIYTLDIMRRRQPKVRRGITGSVIDYEYTNYDPSEVDLEYQELMNELDSLQEALDLTNNTVTFEY